MAQNDTGWVIDGNYDVKIGDTVTKETTDIVCGYTFIPPTFSMLMRRIRARSSSHTDFLSRLCPDYTEVAEVTPAV